MYTVTISAILVIMHVFFILSIIKRNVAVVDIAWGLGFVAVSLAHYLVTEPSLKSGLILFIVAAWGLRLAFHIYFRSRGLPEDFRYAAMRKGWGEHAIARSYVRVFLLQGAIMFVVALPLTVGFNAEDMSLNLVNYLGLGIWALGYFLEVYADAYLARFKKNPMNKGQICMTGPWRICRFPNYLGEIVLWYGIFLTTYSPGNEWSIIGVFVIHFFIFKVSGIPLLEAKYMQREEYREYSQRVSRLIPF
jgi:steroid 5-alpha reductase family enzyme